MREISRIVGFIGAFVLVMSFAACSDDDDLKVEFFLTKNIEIDKCEPVTEFRYGEDIGFILRVWNTSDENIDIGEDRDIIGNDVFTVYKENGEEVGRPWEKWGTTFEWIMALNAGDFKQWYAVWKGVTTRSMVFFTNEDNEPLPVGSYYSRFTIHLPDRDVTCLQRFSVIP